MAIPGRKLDESTRRKIEKLTGDGMSRRDVVKATETCRKTVDKYAVKKNSAGRS